jgi:heptosyltransferase I
MRQVDAELNVTEGTRIAIVMLAAIGDAVHVLPVINAIKRHAPKAHITWITQPGPARLVRGHPAIDRLVVFERSKGWRAFAATRAELQQSKFDIVLDLQSHLKAGILTAMTPAPVRLGYDRGRARDANWLFTNRKIPAHKPQHIQDEYFEFLGALGIAAAPVEWNLGPWASERAAQAALLQPLGEGTVPLVIGTTREPKNWIAERWAQLADALRGDFGLTPVLAGGNTPVELEIQREIISKSKFSHPTTLGIPLRELVALIDGSKLVVSLDTGPLHMSVAVGTPVVSLIGYFNPLRIGPYRKYEDLIVNGYGEMMRGGELALDHRPDGTKSITVRDVLDKVEVWRTRYAR